MIEVNDTWGSPPARKVLIVDIDETLVYGRCRLPESLVFTDYDGVTSYTCPRPDSHQFLSEATLEGWEIISLTQGVVPYQKGVLECSGLLPYFHEVYGWESIYRHSCNWRELREFLGDSKWVLVDNLPHPMLQEKQDWLGHELDPSINFIQCGEFRGQECSSLLELLPKIEELLSLP